MKLLTMRQVASLLQLQGSAKKAPVRALRLLRALERRRNVSLVMEVGDGRGTAARYVTSEDALRRAAPEIFKAARIPPEVAEELERLRRSDVQIRARIGELSRKIDELAAFRLVANKVTS